MAIERHWVEIPNQLFLIDGGQYGQVSVPSTVNIKVKEKVEIFSNSIPIRLTLEVKLVKDETDLELGPVSSNMDQRTDLTAYTVADSAKLFVRKQPRPSILPDMYNRAVYEEEPTVALRVVNVDQYGRKIDSVIDTNGKVRMAVDANVSVSGISTDLDALTPPTRIDPDNVLIVGSENGTKTGFKRALKVQPDSSLDVVDFVNAGTGVEGTLTVGTTPIALKVGGSALVNRRSVTMSNSSSVVIYWGYSSSVTILTGTPIVKNQQARWSVGDGQTIYLVAVTAGNIVRITEGA